MFNENVITAHTTFHMLTMFFSFFHYFPKWIFPHYMWVYAVCACMKYILLWSSFFSSVLVGNHQTLRVQFTRKLLLVLQNNHTFIFIIYKKFYIVHLCPCMNIWDVHRLFFEIECYTEHTHRHVSARMNLYFDQGNGTFVWFLFHIIFIYIFFLSIFVKNFYDVCVRYKATALAIFFMLYVVYYTTNALSLWLFGVDKTHHTETHTAGITSAFPFVSSVMWWFVKD